MKTSRHSVILEIIETNDIETQGQLLQELKNRGFDSTQATISRDIKELRLVKELTPLGAYRYTTSARDEDAVFAGRLNNIFKESVISIDIAQNLVVIKTLPGLASAACSALDGMSVPNLLGTLAGDDTGLLVLKDNQAAEHFFGDVERLWKG